MSSAGGGIDLDKLERELVGALAADRKYSRENDAKFRAVHQKVATYEEFREIVNASHLSPLERKDLTDNTRNQPWNMVAHLGHTDSVSQAPTEEWRQEEITSLHCPKNGQEFWRVWKQKSQEDKYRYLLKLGAENLYKTFKVEISMGLLGELLQALRGGFTISDSDAVLCILDSLSKCSRFNLSLTFLSESEKAAATDLFHQLSLSEQTTCDVSELAKLYSVHLDQQ